MGVIEILVVLLVATLMATAGGYQWSRYLDRQANQAAADQMRLVADAGGKYIKDNYAVVVAQASPTAPAVITMDMLRNTQYLPASFPNQNAYGQNYLVLALAPTPNKLQTLVVTSNGDPIKELYMIDIAKQVGAQGGYISTQNASVATGSFGGWSTALGPYGVAPGAGHLAAALFFQDGALVNDYLYRNAIPGQPNLNRMNTAIDMGGNNLNNAGVVNAQEVRSGKLTSTGRTQVGEYLQLDGVAVEGVNCAPNGLMGRDDKGPLLCVEGMWKKSGGWEFQLVQGTCQAPYKGATTCSLGDTSWKSCSLTGAFGIGDSETGYIFRNANGWYLSTSRLTWPGLFYWSCFK